MGVASSEIKGGHVLPLDCHGVAHNLQNTVKAVKYPWGDYGIQEKSSLRYFREVNKCVNKKEDGHEIQTKNYRPESVKVSRLINN